MPLLSKKPVFACQQKLGPPSCILLHTLILEAAILERSCRITLPTTIPIVVKTEVLSPEEIRRQELEDDLAEQLELIEALKTHLAFANGLLDQLEDRVSWYSLLSGPTGRGKQWRHVERENISSSASCSNGWVDLAHTPGNETVTRRSRRLQGLQPELSTVLAFPARKKMEREENRPFCHRWRDPTVFSGERGEDSQRWLSDFQRVARYNK
ncbi:hypothetical protein LAZ67_12002192 [Cordylochernes scorpioides]|uniref:Uncharacterized protein n=1 Tax=Cordylochernes scorpioides TaxID=51811 RepID=A0ABY6L4D0_9ARAC|nr:hypothetical protein LAZ67_12002192 [Cordylochernes scorpioides]